MRSESTLIACCFWFASQSPTNGDGSHKSEGFQTDSEPADQDIERLLFWFWSLVTRYAGASLELASESVSSRRGVHPWDDVSN